MTGREALNWAARLLVNAGRDDCGGMARRMLEDSIGSDSAALLNTLDTPMDEAALRKFKCMADRAVGGEPLQYVLGRWDFYGRTFACDKRALIPRPETELLVEAALKAIPCGSRPNVLDAGCGTGCIGITAKLERAEILITLCDVSPDALSIARENADALGADVAVIRADMCQRLPGGPYDMILSNPPYVSAREMDLLPREIRNFEPHMALLGGTDGLDFVRALADRAEDSLSPGGSMFVEVGCGQADAAIQCFKSVGMEAEAMPDYAGIPRVVAARKRI